MPESPTPDPPPPRLDYQTYSGSGSAHTDFRGIGGDLLKTFPPLAPSATAPVPVYDPLPGAIDPTRPGFGVGSHRK
jgi:hypothetical protein